MTDNAGLVERLATESSPHSLAQQIVAKMREDAQALTAAEAEIARLTRQAGVDDTVAQQLQGRVADLTIRLEDAEAALTETRAMLAEAARALEPFARAADFYDGRDEHREHEERPLYATPPATPVQPTASVGLVDTPSIPTCGPVVPMDDTMRRERHRAICDHLDAVRATPSAPFGEVRAVSDNGKRWRIVPTDGDWEMVPIGHITARQAEAVCKRIDAALSTTASAPGNGVRDRAIRALNLAIEDRQASDTVEMNVGDLSVMLGLLLAASPASTPGGHVEIAHDGFAGHIIGRYETREGKRGVVVQQDGTRVVHVYGEKWLAASPSPAQGETR